MIRVVRKKPKPGPVKVSDLPGRTFLEYLQAQRKREAASSRG